MAGLSMLHAFRKSIFRLESRLLQVLGVRNPQDGFPPNLALAETSSPTPHAGEPNDGKSALDSIFDSILWIAVPKRRVSVERRMKRRMGNSKIQKFSTPRKDLVSCLDCGHWHEVFTICGKCYEKVKQETKAMKEAMDEDDRLYNAPKTEVVFLYEEEKDDRELHAGKYIVEMNRKRPEWWTTAQLTKAHRRR